VKKNRIGSDSGTKGLDEEQKACADGKRRRGKMGGGEKFPTFEKLEGGGERRNEPNMSGIPCDYNWESQAQEKNALGGFE